MVDPDFTDEFLELGETQIGAGRAFSLGNQAAAGEPGTGTVVGKSWIQIDGRDFLIEKVEFPAIKAQIDALPRAALPAREKLDRLKNLAAKPGAIPMPLTEIDLGVLRESDPVGV